jgi:hypothetical protein
VSNDGHVTDVGRSVHQRPDLDVVLVYHFQTGVVQAAGDGRRGNPSLLDPAGSHLRAGISGYGPPQW